MKNVSSDDGFLWIIGGEVDEALNQLALRLYGAAVDNQGWSEALGAVAHAFRADMAMLMLIDTKADRPRRADIQAACNISPDALAEYGARLAALDPWVRYGVTRMPPMQATRLDRIVPAESFVFTPPFRHFTQHGIPARHILTARFDPTDDGVTGAISLLRTRQSDSFADDSEPVLQALLPHLRRAAGAHARLHGVGLVMAHAMEALGQAIAVLDAAARPLAMNPMFRALVAEGWFLQQQGAIAPAETARSARFAALVAASARGAANAPVELIGGEISLKHPHHRGVLVARIVPQLQPQPSALVLIHDPWRARPPDAGTLRDVFGLTVAEAAVALSVLEGETLAVHAARRGVALATVKTQLAAVFVKTGTTRQVELVRLLAGFGR